jgi:hypothetical protein
MSKVVWNGGEDECWTWEGLKDRKGYGRFVNTDTSQISAHRFSWEYFRGLIPGGLCVLHRCDNPPCVNPDHLFLGTRADNMADALKKRRIPLGEERPNSKLTLADAATIREWAPAGWTQRDLAAAFGVSQSLVSAILSGKAWADVT